MKLKVLYFSLLAFCSLNAQVITNSGFETLDVGVLGNAGAGMPDWYAQTNTTSASDCAGVTDAIPIDDDIRVIDEGGNKAVAIYANGTKCNGAGTQIQNQAAIMAQKFTNLVAGQTYDVSMDVKYSGEPITTGNMNFQIRPQAAYNYAKRLPWLGSDDPRAAYISATAIVNTQGEYVTMTYQFTVPADGKVFWINDNQNGAEVEIEGGIAGVDIFLCVIKGQGVIPNGTDHIIIDNVTVTEGLSNKDFSKFQFNLFPNPATSQLNLKANTSIDDVVVSNTLGQKVKQLHFGTREASIDVSDLNKGIYIVTAKIDGQSGTYRFIKK